jgi:hypothetical protein
VSLRGATGVPSVGGDAIDAAVAAHAVAVGRIAAGPGEEIEIGPGAVLAVLALGLEGQTTAIVLSHA